MDNKEFVKKYSKINFETKNLIIRLPKASDAKDICEALQDKIFSKNISVIPYPFTLANAHKYIKDSKTNLDKPMPTLNFVIYHKKDKKVIGTESLSEIDLKNKHCESGSWITKDYWGTGLIAESRLEVYKFAFNELKLRKIYAIIFDYNIRSQKHIEKFGFKKQGFLRDEVIINKKFVSANYFELLNSEFNYNQLKKKLLKVYES